MRIHWLLNSANFLLSRKKEQYPYFDSDLGFIRAGGEYVCNFDTEELEVRGRSYRLPNNYDDRKSKYDEAIKIFMQEVE